MGYISFDNTNNIVYSEQKLESALATLRKIHEIICVTNTKNPTIKQQLTEAATQIRDGYIRKVDGLNFIIKFFAKNGENFQSINEIFCKIIDPDCNKLTIQVMSKLMNRDMINRYFVILTDDKPVIVTPLFFAVLQNSIPFTTYFLDHGADIEKGRKQGEGFDSASPLAWACLDSTYIDIVELLLSKGADPNGCNENKITPIMVATQKRNIQAIALLKKSGARDDSETTDGKSVKTLMASYPPSVQNKIKHTLMTPDLY